MSTVEIVPSSCEYTRAQLRTFSSDWLVRIPFWCLGGLLAGIQVLGFRYFVTADAVAYMDMSDALMPGFSWHHLVNGVWSPLYPALVGVARRIFHPSPGNEIFFDHVLNLPIFLFAFGCFEFLLLTIVDQCAPPKTARSSIPRPVMLALGYSLFLWASITQITLQSLRPDMLMSAFLYLAIAVVMRIRKQPPNWTLYAALGVVLGVGFLVKAPMLPIGMVVITCSVIAAQEWRRRLPMAIGSLLVLLLVGAFYFVPLSLQLHRFSLGESSRFNYLAHVNHALDNWYGGPEMDRFGVPLHRARRIFGSPATYEFAISEPTTHPLRLDPSYWTDGLKPKFIFGDQLRALAANLRIYRSMLPTLDMIIIGSLLLYLISGVNSVRETAALFPLWLVGLAGVSMYALVHVEDRYVGAFFLLLWLGLLAGLAFSTRGRKVAIGVACAMTAGVLLTLILQARRDYLHPHERNQQAVVASMLPNYGVHVGDAVARISSSPDLGWARAARVTIVSEVDWQQGARSFWTDSPQTQQQVLAAIAGTGAKIVVGRLVGRSAPQDWQRLGNSDYWVHPLNGQDFRASDRWTPASRPISRQPGEIPSLPRR